MGACMPGLSPELPPPYPPPPPPPPPPTSGINQVGFASKSR